MEDNSDSADPLSLLLNLSYLLEGSLFIYSSKLLLILFFLLASAVFSGIEVAFFSLTEEEFNKIRISKLASDRRIAFLLHKPQQLLSTIVICNNLANVLLVSFTTYFAWNSTKSYVYQTEIIICTSVFLAAGIIFFGEIFPKIYANQNSLAYARKTSGLIFSLFKLFKPLTRVLVALDTNIKKRVSRSGYSVSLDELNEAVEITTQKDTTLEEKEILMGIVNFSSTSVKQIMRSRLDIVAFNLDLPFKDLLKQITLQGYSRVPVYSETIDNIEGVLYVKDLLPHIQEDENYEWKMLVRPGFFIPESKKIDDLLKDFQEKKVHIAIVVDEYGGTSGIVTLEDIIEEIVGDIHDEFDDTDEVEYSKLDDRTFIFEGSTSITDFGKISEVEVTVFDEVKEDNESLGGLLLELFARLPSVGEQITYDKFEFTVIGVDEKKINRVKVNIKDQSNLEGQLLGR